MVKEFRIDDHGLVYLIKEAGYIPPIQILHMNCRFRRSQHLCPTSHAIVPRGGIAHGLAEHMLTGLSTYRMTVDLGDWRYIEITGSEKGSGSVMMRVSNSRFTRAVAILIQPVVIIIAVAIVAAVIAVIAFINVVICCLYIIGVAVIVVILLSLL